MYLVGLTGGIASGKSTVTRMLKELGCACIDADQIARQVVEPGRPAHAKIKQHFGEDVFHANNQLNREKLGRIIFDDPSKRQQLNAIVHPAIKKEMMWQILLCLLRGYQFVILDIPLLFETKQMLPYVSYTVVVWCEEQQQLSRLMERNNFAKDEAQSRINSQMTLTEKSRLCTFVIDNSTDIDRTKRQVYDIYKKLVASKKHYRLRASIMAMMAGTVGCLMFLVKYLS